MVKHIVMWNLKDEAEGQTKEQNGIKIKKELEELKNKIDGIIDIEVGVNINTGAGAGDLCLYSVYESEQALKDYQIHPEHQKVREFIKKVIVPGSRKVADYIV